jgi:hypothetical protein
MGTVLFAAVTLSDDSLSAQKLMSLLQRRGWVIE